MGDDVFVTGVGDTILTQDIMRVVKRTQGLWINHSGEDVMAVLNIYIVYSYDTISDFDAYFRPVRIYTEHYTHWTSEKLVCLPPVYVQAWGHD